MRLDALAWWVIAAIAATSVADAAPTVVVNPLAGATNLGLDGEGSATTHIVQVADLSLSTDGPNGFTVSISSGSLTKGDGATPIPFQVTLVADGAAAPSAAAFTVASGSTYTLSTGAAGSTEKDLYIKYTPVLLQDPGAYSASISISIVDN